jgi:hypothetical protein
MCSRKADGWKRAASRRATSGAPLANIRYPKRKAKQSPPIQNGRNQQVRTRATGLGHVLPCGFPPMMIDARGGRGRARGGSGMLWRALTRRPRPGEERKEGRLELLWQYSSNRVNSNLPRRHKPAAPDLSTGSGRVRGGGGGGRRRRKKKKTNSKLMIQQQSAVKRLGRKKANKNRRM